MTAIVEIRHRYDVEHHGLTRILSRYDRVNRHGRVECYQLPVLRRIK